MIHSEDVLSDNAPDREISAYAAQEGWVVFTEDDDFLRFDHDRGIMLYHHIKQPSPGDVLDAIRKIADAYDDHYINEHVPDGWIE